MFCQYRDSLGKPGEGFHTHFLGIAIFDLLGTILIGYVIWKYTDINPWYIGIVLALITILSHRLFCVNTTVNKAIFGQV
jgi:hypothetical protein